MKNHSLFQRLFLCVLCMCCISALQAKELHICVTNFYGEKSQLILTSVKSGGYKVTGTHDYTIFNGTVWPVTGTYCCETKKLHYTATNPNPDYCFSWANEVSFDYDVNGESLSGGFSNSCGLGNSFTASAVSGDCTAYQTITLRKGEYGATGAHKIKRTGLPVPKGENIEELLKVKPVKIDIAPNPASQYTMISFSLKSSTNIQARIYDQQGELMATLAEGTLQAGDHSYKWNLKSVKGVDVKRGFYWLRIITDEGIISKQILVNR